MAGRRYTVVLVLAARRALVALPVRDQRRISKTIDSLEGNPRPGGAALLAGPKDQRIWRIRVGGFRLLYEIRDEQLVVLVIRIGHRREVYRGRPGRG